MTTAARGAFGLLAIALLGSGLKAQSCGTFDVASIKLNTTGMGGGYPELVAGGRRFTATNQLILELIMFAYGVSPGQISGIPHTFLNERYDVEAICDAPITQEHLRDMLQMLLAERFHLSVHRELKEQPVYALIPAKGGPKLHKASEEDGKPVLRQSRYRFMFINARVSNLVDVLSQLTGRKVLDRTGLIGQYDFMLSYAPDQVGAGNAGSSVTPAADDSLPYSIFTALREQLGLNLEAQKRPVDSIVIDRLDRLIPN